MNQFEEPKFLDGDIEFRVENGEVAIYGTGRGLERLAEIIQKLVSKGAVSKTEHVHLEDYELLTGSSLRGTIAIFGEE